MDNAYAFFEQLVVHRERHQMETPRRSDLDPFVISQDDSAFNQGARGVLAELREEEKKIKKN